MAKKIYIGNMIQDLQNSIADLQTDIGTMSTDMASVVAELINVKEAVSSGIVAVPVKAGTTVSTVLNAAEISEATGTATTKVTFMAKCNGIISFSGEAKGTYAGLKIYYSINAGADVEIATIGDTSGAWIPFTKDILVNDNDTVNIKLKGAAAIGTLTVKEGMTASYDIVDVINDGAIIVL